MDIDMEDYFVTRGYDIKSMSDELWDKMQSDADDQVSMMISEESDNIMDEIVIGFHKELKPFKKSKELTE